LSSAKTALKFKYKISIGYNKNNSMYGAGYKLEEKKITHDLNHDLTFYCTHNQLCVPQYEVNV
jgi:hypothetical protein